MELYNNFIGIDIGKYSFVVAVHGAKSVKEYDNDSKGINQFLKDNKKILPQALCILEPTGGYEMRLLMTLCDQNYFVHRAHTRNIKNFIRSYGNDAKTDKLDAKNLSLYGYERASSLQKFKLPSKEAVHLYELIQRRRDLVKVLVAEKNRFKSPGGEYVKTSIQSLIEFLTTEIKTITKEINELIKKDSNLSQKKKTLKSIPGIGDIIANDLLVLMPELGNVNRREIASLAGVAPVSRDSGKMKGYRKTNHGREGIKPMLFTAAMAARNSNSHLKAYYEGLLKRGKSKLVALTALMRKIIVIANAKLKKST